MTYEEAKTELDEIVQALEAGEIGIDDIEKNLKRAQELIAFCQKRLRDLEESIKQVTDEETQD